MALINVGGGLAELIDPKVWADWLASLDRGFAFLLLLPFVVAAVGLWSSYRGGEDHDHDHDPPGRDREGEP